MSDNAEGDVALLPRLRCLAAVLLLSIGCGKAQDSGAPPAKKIEAAGKSESDASAGDTEPTKVDASPNTEPTSHLTRWIESNTAFDSVTIYRVRRTADGWTRDKQLARPAVSWGRRLLREIEQVPSSGERRKRCIFQPGIEVAYRRGQRESLVRLCFGCGDLAVRLRDEAEFSAMRDFVPRQKSIEALLRQAVGKVSLEPIPAREPPPVDDPFKPAL